MSAFKPVSCAIKALEKACKKGKVAKEIIEGLDVVSTTLLSLVSSFFIGDT